MSLKSTRQNYDNSNESCLPGGPQGITLSNMVFDGTGVPTFTFDGSAVAFSAPSSGIRSIYFDARGVVNDVIASVGNGGPTLRIPAGKQGYLPLFAPWPIDIVFSSVNANGTLTVILYNFKISPIIW